MANTKKWSLGTSEVGKVVGKNSGDSVNVHIGKLLPLVEFGEPVETPVGLNGGCFSNADGCKLSLAASVITKNFINIPLSSSESDLADFKKKSAKVGVKVKPTSYTHGAEVKVDIKNGSVEQMVVSGLRDASIRQL